MQNYWLSPAFFPSLCEPLGECAGMDINLRRWLRMRKGRRSGGRSINHGGSRLWEKVAPAASLSREGDKKFVPFSVPTGFQLVLFKTLENGKHEINNYH